MKKFTFLAFTSILLFSFSQSFAQQRQTSNSSGHSVLRCGTMQAMEKMFSEVPNSKASFEENQARLQQAFEEKVRTIVNNRNNGNNRIEAITTIPVVVHIVLPTPANVTDAAVIDQINIMNNDYSGLNPDSANASPFFSVRGHSEIRFCLAQRTPANLPTNGIERRASSTTSSVDVGDPIKYTAQGGLDAWDPTKYLNIWVGIPSNPNILGYATFPGPVPTLLEHGTFINFRAFSSINPTGNTLFPEYNKGRTIVHELGHFFNLSHIWGAAGCANDDGVGDTPVQDAETFGCPGAPLFDACTPGGNGIMFQNYMDYTDDACMTMFTNLQATRMQTALSDPSRVGLVTSNGCVPLVLSPNDATISAVVTPAANFVSCDPTIPLTVTLRNFGSNTLTSVTITVVRNLTTIQTLSLTGLNIPSFGTQNVVLNAVPLVLGANSIQICTSSPNGVVDSNPLNDCITVSGSRGAGGALPLVEGFEGATFPPAGWIQNNPDNGITWQRTTTGVAHSGIAKAFVDHFNYVSAGQVDDLRTPPFAIGTADSLWVSFWGAWRGFPGFPFDQFQVMVSTDCGQTFQIVYSVRNDTAFVAPEGVSPTTAAGYFPSNVDQWVRKSIDLSSRIPAGNIIVQFRAINQFGNNMHLDDINIDKKIFPNNDAGVVAINKPDAKVCTNSQAPVVVIKNFGKVNLTSVKINYQIDGTGPITTFDWTGNLARNQTATVTLATATLGAVGNHSIRVYTTLPNNVADEDPSNDALVKAYTVSQVIAFPGNVTEDFTSATFPPPNWQIINPNADITWTRNASVGKRAPGSAFFNDYVNTNVDRVDDLAMPNYSYSGIDSIFLQFSIAHLTRTLPGTTGSRLDTFAVLLSRDCGNTFTTVYKKWGEDLQTVNDPNFQTSMLPFVPKANEWRTDSLNLGQWLGSTEPLFQIVYRFSGNIENNFYLDDINLRTQTLPVKLKNQGYLVLPNPFRSSFAVWHYQVPATLRYINVYNSVGQLVYSKQFPEGGQKFTLIDLGGRAAGAYTVNIGYEDSNRNVNVQVVKY